MMQLYTIKQQFRYPPRAGGKLYKVGGRYPLPEDALKEFKHCIEDTKKKKEDK